MFRRLVITAALATGVAVPAAGAAAPAERGPATERVIVVLEEGVNSRGFAASEAARRDTDIAFVYSAAINGFAAEMPAGRVNALRRDPRVEYVEIDQQVSIAAQTTPTGIARIGADANPAIDIDGIDDARVDVDVAILDTGIDREHPDLNVVSGVTCLQTLYDVLFGIPANCVDDGGDDDHYHGTHVAGTVGALDNGIGPVGVAPGARLHSVKVLDSGGSGYTSGIVAGIDWVVQRGDIEVANMSLGGAGVSQAYGDALASAKASGVAFAVAAGNDSSDANGYSPAAFGDASRGRLALTVSALADFDGAPGGFGSPTCRNDQDDTLADFSNFGSPVGIIAPGVCIYSTYPLERGSYASISGTSMASPHVAGGLALLASNSPIGPASGAGSVDALFDTLVAAGKSDWNDVDDPDSTKEPLLDVSTFAPAFVGGGGGDPTPDTTAPAVSITSPADGASFDEGTQITFTGTASDAVDAGVGADDLVWTIDGGTVATGASFSTSSLGVGVHTVTAAATDASGNIGSTSISIEVTSVSEPPPATITLTANGYKEKGRHRVQLSWTGASGPVDVWRDGLPIATGVSGGSYLDVTKSRGGATYRYFVCETPDDCSGIVTVVF